MVVDLSADFRLSNAETYAEVYGSEHPATLLARNNVAASLLRLARHKEAERQLRIVIEASQPPDLDTAAAMDNLALILALTDRLQEAAAINARVLELRESLLSKDHLRVAHTLRNRAQIMLELDDFEQALQFARRAKEIYLLNGGESSPNITPTDRTVAQALLDLHRPQEAADLLEATWAREMATPSGPGVPVIVATELAEALCWENRRRCSLRKVASVDSSSLEGDRDRQMRNANLSRPSS